MIKRLSLVLLALVVSGAMIYGRYREMVKKAYVEEYYAAASELQRQQNLCRDALENLRIEWENSRKTAKGILLFQEINRQMYNNAYPIIRDHGIVGTMVLTKNAYPGRLGCISETQMNTLLADGWSVCAGWNGKGEIQEELQELEKVFTALGLDHPYVISIDEGGYDPKMDSVLADRGYIAVILHGESIAMAGNAESAPIRAVPAIYWDEPTALDYLESVMADKNLAILTLDFSSIYGTYYSDLFENMCDYLQKNQKYITFLDLQTAVETSKSDAYYTAMEAYLLREIDRYDQQIQNVFDLYNKYGVDLPKNDPIS